MNELEQFRQWLLHYKTEHEECARLAFMLSHLLNEYRKGNATDE